MPATPPRLRSSRSEAAQRTVLKAPCQPRRGWAGQPNFNPARGLHRPCGQADTNFSLCKLNLKFGNALPLVGRIKFFFSLQLGGHKHSRTPGATSKRSLSLQPKRPHTPALYRQGGAHRPAHTQAHNGCVVLASSRLASRRRGVSNCCIVPNRSGTRSVCLKGTRLAKSGR
jgi:hypothetical protein